MADVTLVVVRRGIYDQGVVGTALSLDEAKAIAERAAEDEDDAYHDFEIRRRVGSGGQFNELVAKLTAWRGGSGHPNRRAGSRRWVDAGG